MHRPNQQLDSNGPEGRVRGTATHIHERYLMQARDAQTVGDTVRAENLLQHAEHYFRLLNLNGQGQQQVNQSRPRNAESDLREDDEDDEDSGESSYGRDNGGYQNEDARQFGSRQQDGRRNDGRYQDNRNQDNRNQDNRNQDSRNQGNRNQDGRRQENRPFEGRQQDGRQQEGRSYEGRHQSGRQSEDRQQDDGAGFPRHRDGGEGQQNQRDPQQDRPRAQWSGDESAVSPQPRNEDDGLPARYLPSGGSQQAAFRNGHDAQEGERADTGIDHGSVEAPQAEARSAPELPLGEPAGSPAAEVPEVASEVPVPRTRRRRTPVAPVEGAVESAAPDAPTSDAPTSDTPASDTPASDTPTPDAPAKPRTRRRRTASAADAVTETAPERDPASA